MELILSLLLDLLYRFYLFVRYRDGEKRQALWMKYKDMDQLTWTFWLIPLLLAAVFVVFWLAMIFLVFRDLLQ